MRNLDINKNNEYIKKWLRIQNQIRELKTNDSKFDIKMHDFGQRMDALVNACVETRSKNRDELIAKLWMALSSNLIESDHREKLNSRDHLSFTIIEKELDEVTRLILSAIADLCSGSVD